MELAMARPDAFLPANAWAYFICFVTISSYGVMIFAHRLSLTLMTG
jgi:hypothetical protein